MDGQGTRPTRLRRDEERQPVTVKVLALSLPEEAWQIITWRESTMAAGIAFGELVDATKLRWRIERDYRELKQEVGLGHFEGRSWRGFHHHATFGDEQSLSRLGLGQLSSAAFDWAFGLRLRHGRVFEPQAGTGDVRLGSLSLCCGQPKSRSRHHRRLSAALFEGDRGAVRQGSAVSGRDGPLEVGDGRPGRDEDPRQREQAQRAVL